MSVCWKVIIAVFVFYTIAIDGNVARRRRRQIGLNVNPNPAANSFNQLPHPSILNAQGPPPSPNQHGLNEPISGKQGARQYYSPYQGQTGYGSVQGLNYPYAGAGVGSYQYGSGQYGQPGQGLGQYGAYYNQNPGSNSFYGGYNSGGYNSGGYNSGGQNSGGYYNRPGYSNYYPSSGGNSYGGYFWNAGQKQHINKFTVFLSSILMFVVCLMTV